jgi:trehalose-6-phosphatase
VFYMGDDWTDEYAFEVLVGKAVTVRVGDGHEPSKADYRISDVDGVERLLTNIASAVVDRRAS